MSSDINRAIAERLEPEPKCDTDGIDEWYQHSGSTYRSKLGMWHTEFGEPIRPAPYDTDPAAMMALIEALAQKDIAFQEICGPDSFEDDQSDRYCVMFCELPETKHQGEGPTMMKAVRDAAARALNVEVINGR